MSRVEEHLGELGVTLPHLPTPLANYVPAKRAGNLVFTAGQVSAFEGRAYKGKLGATLGIEDGRAATRACVINCLAAIKSAIGSLAPLWELPACLWDLLPQSTSSLRLSSWNALHWILAIYREKVDPDSSRGERSEARNCISTGGPYA